MLLNRDVSRNPEVVLGTGFGGFCDWYLRFNCPKHVLGAAQDRLDPVCVFACVSVVRHFLQARFWTSLSKNSSAISEKLHPKRALLHGILNPTRSFSCHIRLASVVALSSSGDCGATFPLGLIGGVAVGDMHLWRHLPPRVQF